MGKYFLSFLLALSLHLSIIALFAFSLPEDSPTLTRKKEAPAIIQATILDESVVTAKAEELKQREKKQQQAYASKLAQEKQQLQKLKTQRQQAEKAAKKQAEQLKKAAQQEQQKLQSIKQKLALEKKKQQKIKKQREAEEKQRAIDKKRKAEAERVAEAKRKKAKAKQDAAKKEAAKQKKIAAEKQQKAQAEKLRLEAVRQTELNKQRAENARIAEQATANATALIKRKITQNWNRPGSVPVNLKCKIRIGLIASGDVMSVVIVESSGNPLFDNSAERAVRKASPLPVPKDANIFKRFRSFNLEFSPDK